MGLKTLAGRGLCVIALLAPAAIIAAAPASAAVNWETVDRSCSSGSSGSVCVTQQRAAVDGVWHYRAWFAIDPAPDKWIQPIEETIFMPNAGSSEPFCSGGCPRMTSYWKSPYARWQGARMVYVADYRTPTGTYRIAAGSSDTHLLDRTCSSGASGTVCIRLYMQSIRLSSKMTSKLSVDPASGRSITPRWVTIITDPTTGTTRTRTADFCDPSCTPRTSPWAGSVVDTNNFSGFNATARGSYSTPTGTYTISASW